MADAINSTQTQKGEITLHDVISAFEQELRQLRGEHYSLQRQVDRYNRVFERMFREELESRVGDKNQLDQGCSTIGPLGRLRMDAEKAKYAAAEELRRG